MTLMLRFELYFLSFVFYCKIRISELINNINAQISSRYSYRKSYQAWTDQTRKNSKNMRDMFGLDMNTNKTKKHVHTTQIEISGKHEH